VSGVGALTKYRLCYLATPYSKYPGGIDLAFGCACDIAGFLIRHGVRVFSPICHTHPIAVACGMDPLDHTIWLSLDRPMIDAADCLVVAMMAGWQESQGVNQEIIWFRCAGKPVFFLDLDAWSVSRLDPVEHPAPLVIGHHVDEALGGAHNDR
jgi:hypothetical protein